MTLILNQSKKRRPDRRPKCQDITARRQACQFHAVEYVDGRWVCRHHGNKARLIQVKDVAENQQNADGLRCFPLRPTRQIVK